MYKVLRSALIPLSLSFSQKRSSRQPFLPHTKSSARVRFFAIFKLARSCALLHVSTVLAFSVSIVPFVHFTARVPSNPYRASASLPFQFCHSLLELLCSCVRCWGRVGSFTSLFQVREVRVLISGHVSEPCMSWLLI